MTNDRDNTQQPYPDAEREENNSSARLEQFNELSELSLEERIAVADRIGIPVNDIREAVALGTMQNRDESTEGLDRTIEDENNRE
jgi:hypothetical protein